MASVTINYYPQEHKALILRANHSGINTSFQIQHESLDVVGFCRGLYPTEQAVFVVLQ